MLARLFTPECWQRSMHYSTAACIYQADSQLETSCTHAGHVTTSRSRKQVRDRLPPPLSLCSRFSSKWIADVYGFELHLIQVSSPLGLRAISQQRFAALSRITGPPRFPFVEWMVEQATIPVVAPLVFENRTVLPALWSTLLSPGIHLSGCTGGHERNRRRAKFRNFLRLSFSKFRTK